MIIRHKDHIIGIFGSYKTADAAIAAVREAETSIRTWHPALVDTTFEQSWKDKYTHDMAKLRAEEQELQRFLHEWDTIIAAS